MTLVKVETLSVEQTGRRMVTCQRTVSALTGWRRDTGTEGATATMTRLSWTPACSWTGPGPSSENKP